MDEFDGRAIMQRLVAAGREMRGLADKINLLLKAVDDQLGQSGVGLTDEVQLPSSVHGSSNLWLAYGRINGQFHLHVVEHAVGWSRGGKKDDVAETTRLDNCSMDVRIEAFQQLPALLERLVDEVGRLARKVSETTARMQPFLDAIREVSRG